MVRTFETGATRDTDEGKLSYMRFLSPMVLQRFGEYMQKHRLQTDGELRDWDNWKQGMPLEVYLDSLLRHVVDVWMLLTGEGQAREEDLEDPLCACLFNVQGMLLEVLKAKRLEEQVREVLEAPLPPNPEPVEDPDLPF